MLSTKPGGGGGGPGGAAPMCTPPFYNMAGGAIVGAISGHGLWEAKAKKKCILESTRRRVNSFTPPPFREKFVVKA